MITIGSPYHRGTSITIRPEFCRTITLDGKEPPSNPHDDEEWEDYPLYCDDFYGIRVDSIDEFLEGSPNYMEITKEDFDDWLQLDKDGCIIPVNSNKKFWVEDPTLIDTLKEAVGYREVRENKRRKKMR